MKVSIGAKVFDGPWGGGNLFVKNLSNTLKSKGHEVVYDLKDNEKENLRFFVNPSPAREVSLLYNKNELKIQIIDSIQQIISGIIRGAIKFQDVKIISPK